MEDATIVDGAAREEPRASRVGQILAGKYRITRLLGEGGMGAVYEAQHVVLTRRFAVKFVHPELARRPEILGRFRREAQTAGSLENENIAAITDLGTAEDGAPYLVMEFLQGADLGAVLAEAGPMPVPRAAHLVIQACRGLEAAHEKGITHRDLKPENLFVCKRGDGGDLVKILDFGIAKLRDGDDSTKTQTGSAIGTPFYMPPQQARGSKELDHRADIYALGVILYELLTCERPHPGDGYNAILFHILTQPPVPLATLRKGLPEDFVAVVEKAMATEAKHRFGSAMELARALAPFVGRAVTPPEMLGTSIERIASGSTTMATPVALDELPAAEAARAIAASPVSRGASMTVPTPEEAASKRGSSKLGPILGALGALALLGVLATVVSTKKSEVTPTSSVSAPLPSSPSAPSASMSAGVSGSLSADTAPVMSAPAGPPSASGAPPPKPPIAVKTAPRVVRPPAAPKSQTIDPYAP